MVNNSISIARPYSHLHQREFDIVIEHIDRSREGISRFILFNFFAPRGFGKSALLQRLWNRYADDSFQPMCLASVKDSLYEEGVKREHFLQQLIGQISDRLPPLLTRKIDESLPPHNGISVLVTRLVKLVQASADFQKCTILLIDDYDLLPFADQRWFEANVLGSISSSRQVTVVASSQIELRFDRLDLQTRLQSYELSSLTAEEISTSYPEYSGIVDELRRLTGGLPGLIARFIDELQAGNISEADFGAREQAVLRKHYGHLVTESVLNEITPELHETILVLSVLRRYDVGMLHSVLAGLLPETYETYETLDYLDLLDRLSPWSQWRLQGGYAVNPAIASVLRVYVIAEKPKMYRAVNRVAAGYYISSLSTEYKEHYLVEMLFHRVALQKSENEDPAILQELVKNELLAELGRHVRVQEDLDLDSLRNSLLSDPDLKVNISTSLKSALQQIVQEQLESRDKAKVVHRMKIA